MLQLSFFDHLTAWQYTVSSKHLHLFQYSQILQYTRLSYQFWTWHCCKWQLNGFNWDSDTLFVYALLS